MRVNNGTRETIIINGIEYTAGVAETSSGTYIAFPRGTRAPSVGMEFYRNEKVWGVDKVDVNRVSGMVTIKVIPRDE